MGSRRDGNRLMSVVPQFNAVESSRWEVCALFAQLLACAQLRRQRLTKKAISRHAALLD